MMTFTESIKSTLTTNYVKFSGRATRSEFWWFELFLVIVNFALGIIRYTATNSSDSILHPTLSLDDGTAAIIAFFLSTIVHLALLLPSLGLMVRRMHDRNMSGWWLLLFLIPFVNFIFALFLLVNFILTGVSGPNKYGPDPLQPASVANVFA